MSGPGVLEKLKPIFHRVHEQLHHHLNTDVPFVSQVAGHILFSGGKHLRPTLFVISAQICEYPDDKEFFFSSVFEYLHAATLLHDDVIDQADTRRGQKAAHLVYGNPGVILVGDFLLAKSMALGADTGILEFTEVMSRTVASMSEGEVLQLLNRSNPDISEEDYFKVIHRKTGVLIESACYLGAVFARAPSVQASALKSYGKKIGLAFQVVDDCLDYRSTEAEFGKPVGHDLDEGKVTLPLILAMQKADPQNREELRKLIVKNRRTPQEFTRIKDLIDQYEGVEAAMDRAAQFVEEGKDALNIFPESHLRAALFELADFIVARRN